MIWGCRDICVRVNGVIEKFGDKAVDNYLKLTCRNPRMSIDGKEYFGIIFAKKMLKELQQSLLR